MAGIPWTEKEKGILKTIADNKGTIEDAMKILPGRSKDSIDAQMLRLGLTFSRYELEINEDAFKTFLKSRQIVEA